METFYKGTEIKFKVKLNCVGFSMTSDNFQLKVVSGKTSVSIEKSIEDTIGGSREEVIVTPEGAGSLSRVGDDYFAYVDREYLAVGAVKVIGTAQIDDSGATGGKRQEVCVDQLCNLVDPLR